MHIYQTPTPAPVAATPSVAPGPAQMYEALSNQKTVLRAQLDELTSQRGELTDQLAQPGVGDANRKGLEERVIALDKRIAATDDQMAAVDLQLRSVLDGLNHIRSSEYNPLVQNCQIPMELITWRILPVAKDAATIVAAGLVFTSAAAARGIGRS